MADKPEILQMGRLPKATEAALVEHFTVHRLDQAADADAFIAGIGSGVRGLTGGKVDKALMDKLPKLEIIANFGVGYDGVDIREAKARGIRVTNTPEVLNDAVAELAIGMMVALARNLVRADAFVRDGTWEQKPMRLTAELTGRTLGILGLGRIGKEIAVRAQAMKMRVVYHGRRRQPNEPFVYYDSLVDMARDADWLVVIAPGGKGTEKIVSRDVLEALGPEGYLVNLARGTLVDEKALIELLADGRLGGAALDVFETEPKVPEALRRLENVVLAPHMGSGTRQTRDAMGARVVDNLVAHFAGDPLPSAVV